MDTQIAEVQIVDLGDARIETQGESPVPPLYPDSIYGLGAQYDKKP